MGKSVQKIIFRYTHKIIFLKELNFILLTKMLFYFNFNTISIYSFTIYRK